MMISFVRTANVPQLARSQLEQINNLSKLEVDLCVVSFLNSFICEVLFRASLCCEAKVLQYKTVLQELIRICSLEDDIEIVDTLLNSETNQILAPFVRLSGKHKWVLSKIEGFSVEGKRRFSHLIEVSCARLATVLNSANSCLLESELDEIQSNVLVNNNNCERAFAVMDYVSRTRSNLSYINKETVVLCQLNGFVSYFNSLSSFEQKDLFESSKVLVQAIRGFLDRYHVDEQQLRQDSIRDRLQEAQSRLNKDQEKAREIRNSLNEDIPYSASSYQAKWSKYHRDNPGISEFQYLKKLLVLKKIELREKNLPARNFTTSFSGKLLTVAELRAKLFNLFEQ